MLQIDNSDYNLSNSSSFVGYKDYSSSSVNNFVIPIFPINIIIDKNPTLTTIHAIKEAENKETLVNYNTVKDFFNDLET